MSSTVTRLALRTEILQRVDDPTAAFFSTTFVNGLIDSSRRQLHNKLVTQYGERYARARGVVTTAVGTQRYTLPSTDIWTSTTKPFLSLLRATIAYGPSQNQRIFHVENGVASTYENLLGTWGYGAWVGYELDEAAITFWPSPSGVFTVNLDYVPAIIDLANDNSTMESFNGFATYVVLDVCAQLAAKEADSDQIAFFVAEREKVWNDFKPITVTDAGDAIPAQDVEAMMSGRRTGWRYYQDDGF